MMKKKQIENKLHAFNPAINFTNQNEIQPNQNQIKGILNRSKTPFYRKKSVFTTEEENCSSGTLNKSINNQTFIYNSINFNNQGLFNNINNNNHKRRKSGGNNYMVNNGILGLFETMKKSRSISKQKNNSNKYMNIINKLTNNQLFYKSLSKHKSKSNSKQKNNSFKNEKKKLNTLINANNNIITNPNFVNNTNTIHRKNKNKLMTTNYNINKNFNMMSILNNNKINHILASSTGKTRKVKKSTDINLTNKEVNTNKNKINLIKNIQFLDSERNTEIKKLKNQEENITIFSEYEKNIFYQIESLISKLLSNCSSPKNIIIKELVNIIKKVLGKFNINFKLENEINILYKKKSNKNLNFSKNGSKNNLMADSKNKNQKDNTNKNNNKDIIEKELNILNKKYNQIKEENINLKYLITEKTTAFEDVKNSLKNFQLEINQLKNNNSGNNSIIQNPNSLRNKNEDYNIDSSIQGNISLNSRGVEMKNIKLNLSNIQKLKEIQNINGLNIKYGTKKESQENNTDANTNKDNNIFNCNNYSFGQNNSFEINLENYNESQKNILNSNRSLDPLSLTFHEQTINPEEDGNEIKQKISEKHLKDYEITPSVRKNTEILIKTGIYPVENKKF